MNNESQKCRKKSIDQNFLTTLQALIAKAPNKKSNSSVDISAFSMSDNSHLAWNMEEDIPLIAKATSQYLSDNYSIERNDNQSTSIQKRKNKQSEGNILHCLLKINQNSTETPKWRSIDLIKKNSQTNKNQLKIQNILFGQESMASFISEIESKNQNQLNQKNNKFNSKNNKLTNSLLKQQRSHDESQCLLESFVFSKETVNQRQNSQHFSAVVCKENNHNSYNISGKKGQSEQSDFEFSKENSVKKNNIEQQIKNQSNKLIALQIFDFFKPRVVLPNNNEQQQSKLIQSPRFTIAQALANSKKHQQQHQKQQKQQNGNIYKHLENKYEIKVSHVGQQIKSFSHILENITMSQLIPYIKSLNEQIHELKQKIYMQKDQESQKEKSKKQEQREQQNRKMKKYHSNTQLIINSNETSIEYGENIKLQIKKIKQERDKFEDKYRQLKKRCSFQQLKNEQNQRKMTLLNKKLKGYENLIIKQQLQIETMIFKFNRQMQTAIQNKYYKSKPSVKKDAGTQTQHISTIRFIKREKELKSVIEELECKIIRIQTHSISTDLIVKRLEDKIVSLTQKIHVLDSNQQINKQLKSISSTDVKKSNQALGYSSKYPLDKLQRTQSLKRIGEKPLTVNGKQYCNKLFFPQNEMQFTRNIKFQ